MSKHIEYAYQTNYIVACKQEGHPFQETVTTTHLSRGSDSANNRETMEAVFSVRSVPRPYKESVLS
jgi:hypothetical protein